MACCHGIPRPESMCKIATRRCLQGGQQLESKGSKTPRRPRDCHRRVIDATAYGVKRSSRRVGGQTGRIQMLQREQRAPAHRRTAARAIAVAALLAMSVGTAHAADDPPYTLARE